MSDIVTKEWKDIAPLLTSGFLDTLREAAKVYGHAWDWQVVREFVRECHYQATGVSPTSDFYAPYE